jgi:hypothetical protein
MTQTDHISLFVIVIAGLTSGCGQNAATAEDREQPAFESRHLEDNVSGVDDLLESSATTQVAAPTAANPLPAVFTPGPAPEKAAAATVSTLPLKRGFYVASEIPCGSASNATLRLVTREGINWSRGVCTFKRIEKIGATSYQVAEQCSGGGASTTTYEVPNDTSFTARNEGGSESSARYCNQSSLPDPWRDNDISDLIG